MVPLAPLHPDRHSCLLREEFRASSDLKKKKKKGPDFALKNWISTNHPKTETQSKVRLSRESVSFLVKRQNLKSIAIYFTDWALMDSFFL